MAPFLPTRTAPVVWLATTLLVVWIAHRTECQRTGGTYTTSTLATAPAPSTPPATGLSGACYASSGGVTYIFGGTADAGRGPPYSSTLYTYTHSSGVWTTVPAGPTPHPPPRHQCALAAVPAPSPPSPSGSSVVYLIGGSDDAVALGDFWAWDSGSGAWTNLTSLADASGGARGGPVWGHGLEPIVDSGGTLRLVLIPNTYSLDVLDVYTPTPGASPPAGSWATVAAPSTAAARPESRVRAGFASFGGHVVVFGGLYEKLGIFAEVNDVFVLDAQSPGGPWTWSAVPMTGPTPSTKQGPMMVPLGGASSLDSKVAWVVGGYSGSGPVAETHHLLIDPSGAGSWVTVSPLAGSLPSASWLAAGGVSEAGDQAVLYGGLPTSSAYTVAAVGPRIDSVTPMGALESGGTTLTVTGTLAASGADLDAVVLVHRGTGARTRCPVSGFSGTPVTSLTCTLPTGGPLLPTTVFDSSDTAAYLVAINVSASLPPVSGITTFEVVPRPAPGSVTDPTDGDAATPASVAVTLTVAVADAATQYLALDASDVVSVTLGGSTPCSSVAFVSRGELRCDAPALAAGAYNVTVTSLSGGASDASLGPTVVFVPQPSIASVSSLAGKQSGGEEITLTGSWLGGTGVDASGLTGGYAGLTLDNPVVEVRIAGSLCVVTAQSSSQVVCTTSPFSAAGSFPVQLTTRNGGSTTTAVQFTVNAAPAVTGVDPTSGPVGTTVRVTGTNLGASPLDILSVMVGDSVCSPDSTENTPVTVINCKIAEGGSLGVGRVVVTSSSGGVGTSSVTFEVVAGEEVGEAVRADSGSNDDDEWPLWLVAVVVGGSVGCCCLLLLLLLLCRRRSNGDKPVPGSSYEYEYEYEEDRRPAPVLADPPTPPPSNKPNKMLLKKRVRRRKADIAPDLDYESVLDTDEFLSSELSDIGSYYDYDYASG